MTEFSNTASVDGVVTSLAEARVPIMDRGFLYGDSIYEVFRTYRGVPLFYEEHWRRLENSASLIGMAIGYSADAVFAEIRRAVDASGASAARRDVYVRFVVTRGEGALDLLPSADEKTRLVIIVKEVPQWRASLYDPGAHVAIVSTRRNPGEALDPNIKGGNYLNNVLAVIEANQKGADDCLMLNDAGLVTEASNSNIFFVLDGRLVTPSQVAANLRGLTKAAIHEACVNDGLSTAEVEISSADAARASECFLSSATREVMPVRRLTLEDGRAVELPAGGGELTRRVRALYRAHVDRYVAAHAALKLFDFPN
jgi:branched-chain amino acid aminotransferase